MNPQEFSSPSPGQPPQPSAFARFNGLARGVAANTLLIAAVALGAENALLPQYRPSAIMDWFVGKPEKPETPAKQDCLKALSDLADFVCFAAQFMPDDPALQQACAVPSKRREQIAREQAEAGCQGGSVQPRPPEATVYLLRQ